MLVLPTLYCLLLTQPDLGSACLHSVKKIGHVSCTCIQSHFRIFRTHAFFRIFRTHAGLAVHAGKETVRLLHKVLYT